MSIKHAKECLERMRNHMECDSGWADNSPIGCRELYYILKAFVKELEKE